MEERSLSVRARKKVKAQIEKAERERHAKMFQRRMELARIGATAFRGGKFKESIQSYYGYIDILEKAKEVSKDALQPKDFDPKKETAELLLLTGVYWDLCKMHDLGGKKTYEKLKFYLDRFVTFSRGMPFQHVSAELIRKFLVNGNPRHRREFKDAHLKLGGGKCFLATAVEDYLDPSTLPSLRKFRDEVLLQRHSGRLFVKVYYRIGPTLARGMIRLPEFIQKGFARLVDYGSDSRWIKREIKGVEIKPE